MTMMQPSFAPERHWEVLPSNRTMIKMVTWMGRMQSLTTSRLFMSADSEDGDAVNKPSMEAQMKPKPSKDAMDTSPDSMEDGANKQSSASTGKETKELTGCCPPVAN